MTLALTLPWCHLPLSIITTTDENWPRSKPSRRCAKRQRRRARLLSRSAPRKGMRFKCVGSTTRARLCSQANLPQRQSTIQTKGKVLHTTLSCTSCRHRNLTCVAMAANAQACMPWVVRACMIVGCSAHVRSGSEAGAASAPRRWLLVVADSRCVRARVCVPHETNTNGRLRGSGTMIV